MSEVLAKLTEDFSELTKELRKLTEVLSQMTERIFQMTEGPKYLTEHPPVNVRTPTKIGNEMSEPMGKLSEWVFTPQNWIIFLSFSSKINKAQSLNLLKTFPKNKLLRLWSCFVLHNEFPN
ncbi:hypothetical protein B4U37_01260 [Sutcliffiella horikoshii]|uniref:Uncharacterized protein n=1 Tax=Sutcliffiella horikoshii TaxID=79883 RepID=A0ABM6KED4_9BACI|nr:hypothetical protein B4U37_01260 [Sutcliffiella horikoshii]